MKKSNYILALLCCAALLSTGCGSKESAGLTSGTFSSTQEGFKGNVTVEVTFADNAIESIEITEHQETKGMGDVAMDAVIEGIVDGQTLAVDVVSGATYSCVAVLNAVEDCISQAGGDVNTFK